MKKIILNLSILALVASGCGSKKTNDTETTAKTEERSDFIEIDKLVLKGDVYYLNNVPFTGKAKEEQDCCTEIWEMKDGKFHGKYEGEYPVGTTTGTYKEGKKHGEWIDILEPPYETRTKQIENYKDGKKHGEWKYFWVEQRWDGEKLKYIDHLIKTETYKNDKLMATTAAMPSQNYVGTWTAKGEAYENTHLLIWNIFDEKDHKEVDFSWYIISRVSAKATATIVDGRIFFVTIDDSEHTEETYYKITGTMEFGENSILLTIEESENPLFWKGATYLYDVKAEG